MSARHTLPAERIDMGGYALIENAPLGHRNTLRVDARDHIFQVDLLGDKQTNHNLEFTGGLSIFF